MNRVDQPGPLFAALLARKCQGLLPDRLPLRRRHRGLWLGSLTRFLFGFVVREWDSRRWFVPLQETLADLATKGR